MPPILTCAELAYIAGLFDGEGSGGVYKHHTAPTHTTNTLEARIAVVMCDPDPVRFLSLCFGGNVTSSIPKCKTYKYPGGKEWKRVYRWSRSGKSAQLVATAIMPYIKNESKAAQLQQVLDWKSKRV